MTGAVVTAQLLSSKIRSILSKESGGIVSLLEDAESKSAISVILKEEEEESKEIKLINYLVKYLVN